MFDDSKEVIEANKLIAWWNWYVHAGENFSETFGYWYFQTSLQSTWPAKTMYWPRSRRSVQSKEYWRLKVKINSLLSWDQIVRQSWAFLLVTYPHHSHHCSLPYILQYLHHCLHHEPHYKCHQYHHHQQHNSLLATFLRSGLSRPRGGETSAGQGA